jgi:hypothetical protein
VGSVFCIPVASVVHVAAGMERSFRNGMEETIRTEPLLNATLLGSLVCLRRQYPDLAIITLSPVASPLLEFSAPVFMELTDRTNCRALIDHFCNVLSHLIVFKEDTGNHFLQLILLLSHASSPVMNAIFALSSAHLEYRWIENEEKSLDFHNRACRAWLSLLIKVSKRIRRFLARSCC